MGYYTFGYADFGALGLQTTFALCNTHLGDTFSVEEIIDKIAVKPREILGIKVPTITENTSANLTIFNPDIEWTFTKEDILSKSKNSPIIGMSLRGKVLGVVNNSQMKTFA